MFYTFSFYTTDFNLIAYLICNILAIVYKKNARENGPLFARSPYLKKSRFGAETSDDVEAGTDFRKSMSGDELEPSLELSYSSSEFDEVHSESIVPFLYEPQASDTTTDEDDPESSEPEDESSRVGNTAWYDE